MRIDSNQLSGAGLGGVAGPQQTSGTDAAARAADRGDVGAGEATSRDASSLDTTQISTLAKALSAQDPNSPERLAHLDRIAASIRDGSYHVDPAKVAAKIVDDALQSPSESK